MPLNGIREFCVIMADSVPGVSGETIVFLLGFYDELISSLNGLMGKDNARRKQVFIFPSRLGIGWILGFCLSVLVPSGLFQDYIYRIGSVFMGLTPFAIPMIIREGGHSMKRRYGNLIFTFTETALVSCISYFDPTGGQGIDVSIEHLLLELVVYMFIAAMVTTTAMVLPGISGSTLLLVFGIYVPIIGAVREFLHISLNYVPILAVFDLGVITGIMGIIRLIKLCFERYRSRAIYTIIDLIIGSLYVITMGPTTLDVSRDPTGLDTLGILFFLPDGLILAGLGFIKAKLEKQ